MFYSPSTNGFYVTGIHAAMPDDATSITNQQHAALLEAQSAGKRIQPGLNGLPIAVDMPPAPVVIPSSLSMRQARLALLGAGLLDAVHAGVSAMPQAAQIEWDYATTVERSSPLVATLAASLGLTSEALDALFTAGAAL